MAESEGDQPDRTEPAAPIPLFTAAAARPRDPMDFTFHTLGEVFADLLYQVKGGEDIRGRLEDFARIAANEPVPRSIADADDDAHGDSS